jgi:hypothetical protein
MNKYNKYKNMNNSSFIFLMYNRLKYHKKKRMRKRRKLKFEIIYLNKNNKFIINLFIFRKEKMKLRNFK